jgi:hypothetical protein
MPMCNLTTASSTGNDSIRVIQHLALPCFRNLQPGPLHTIISDPDGNMYYSDEVNHSVVSLNCDGSLRWHKTKRGTAPCEFWYPSGLSLGCIELHGEVLNCLAVADSWNRRVQFLDVEGNPLAIWTHAGERPFGEVADLRFIRENADSGTGYTTTGFWYVLDRGNHCLCRLAINGNLVDQIGRCFPQNMQRRWAIPEIFFSEGSQDIEALGRSSPFDFTFYPERILGYASDALFIAESGCQRLKQVTPPHLFPFYLETDSTLQWIAADLSGLLAYDHAGSRLMRQGNDGRGWDQAEILGRPVFSDLSLDGIWLQINNRIEKCKWEITADRPKSNYPECHSWILHSDSEETNRLDPADISKAVEDCLVHLDEEIRLADTILAMGEKDMSPQFVEGMSGHVPDFPIKCSWASQRVHETLHRWCLDRLERHLAGSKGQGTLELSGDLKQMQSILAKQIGIRMADILKRVYGLSARMQSQKTTDSEDASMSNSWVKVALMAKSNLKFAIEWISSWSGITISQLDRKIGGGAAPFL